MKSSGDTRGTGIPPCGRNTDFPGRSPRPYRASFIKPGVLDGIDPEAFVDAQYQKTLAETSVRPGLSPLEQRTLR